MFCSSQWPEILYYVIIDGACYVNNLVAHRFSGNGSIAAGELLLEKLHCRGDGELLKRHFKQENNLLQLLLRFDGLMVGIAGRGDGEAEMSRRLLLKP